MLRWPFIWLSKIGAIGLVVYIISLGWQNLGPRKPGLSAVRMELANEIISNVVEDIRISRGDIHQSVILHFGNDPSDYFTNKLREVLEQRGTLNLGDRTIWEKTRNILNLRHPTYPSVEEALARGRDLDAQGVLFGAIEAFESYPGGSLIDVQVNLADVSTGEIIFSKQYTRNASPTGALSAVVRNATASFPWFKRFLYWVIIVLLLPVFTIGFIRTMVQKKSNRSNAFVLSVYTLIDALFAWLLVGAALNSWFIVVIFIMATAVAFLYNVRIMSFVVRLEEA